MIVVGTELPFDNGCFVKISPILGRATIIKVDKCRSGNGILGIIGWCLPLGLKHLYMTGNSFAAKQGSGD